jgi:3-oxoacid CoA-transferase
MISSYVGENKEFERQ